MKMKLDEVKKEIVITDRTVQQQIETQIQVDNDCFGSEWSSSAGECRLCTIVANIKGISRPLWVFCEELTRTGGFEFNAEVSKIQKLFSDFKKLGRPEHEWPDFLHKESTDRNWHSFSKRRMLRVEVE